jgi:hypothetical protein
MTTMKMLVCLMLLINHVDAKGFRSRSITTGSKIARDKQLCYLHNMPSVEFCEKNYPKQEELPLTSSTFEIVTIIIIFIMFVVTVRG